MLTISKALTMGQAKDYYQEDYSNAEGNYYSQGDTIKGEWFGRLAIEWGLAGEVKQEQYERLVEGQDPHTGEQLIRHVNPYTYVNQYGEEMMTKGHRAGWDATFSAPKTVSLAALVGGDDRIREAHRKAVDAALVELERYIQAKMGNTRPSITTGRMVAAKFEHDTARPDKKFNYAAPQLHTHAIIFNLTQLLGGKWRALDSTELFKSQRYGTAIYRAVLAIELRRLGYEIEVDGRTGAPEIVGFPKEYLEASSLRGKELRKEAAEMKARLEAEGHIVRDGAGLRQAAASANKRGKGFDREEMLDRHQEMDRKYGGAARQAVAAARERGPIEHSPEEVMRRARESVTFGIARVMDSEAVGDARDLLAHSLRRNMGLTTYEAVKREIAAREREGGLIGILREERTPEVTTRRTLDLERANIRKALEGKGTQEPVIEALQAGPVIDEVSRRQGRVLNDSQREAVVRLLTSRDRIVGLQGRAGTGKTTVLSVLREAAEGAGYEVRGFAPTTRAVKELSESGIETITLQRFTFSKRREDAAEGKRLYVLDESSLASTYHVKKFFERLTSTDRVLLVGDVRQHQAIEAGSPFEQLQRNRMETVRLTQIVRQRDERLKRVVEKLAERKVRDAVRDLIGQGRVREFADDVTRLRAMAADYCAKRDDTLVISPANEERVLLNMMIRRQLQNEGVVNQEDHKTRVYVNRADMTKSERTFAGAYDPGDVIRYNHRSEVYGTRVGDYGRVVSRDREENTITVELIASSRKITYDPRRLSGVSVYVEAERDFAIGDRIQFRAPLAAESVANGDFGVIREISDRQWKVELDGGRVVKVDPNAFRHIDHGYTVTSYSAQCATFSRALINADTKESALLLNQRMGYVGVSRARQEARVYTDSVKKLGEALDRRVDKEMALEAMAQNRLKAKTTGDARGKAVEPYRAQERASAQNVAARGAARTDSLAERSNEPAALTRSGQKAPRPPRAFKKVVMRRQSDGCEQLPRAEEKLVRVTRREPCPICQKPTWCSVSADRAFAICMRAPAEREAKNGGFIHILDESMRGQARPVPVEVKQHQRADVSIRDEMNRHLLRDLKLRPRDRADLLRRGLDEVAITRNGYKSVPLPSELNELMEKFEGKDPRGVPGFFRKDGAWRLNIGEWKDKHNTAHSFHQGYLIPVRDVLGCVEGFQIRRANVVVGEPRYIWLSSNEKEEGTSSGAPIHYRNVEQARKSGQAIITEGSLKADVSAHLLNNKHAVIAVAGVSSFPEDFGRRLKSQIPELRQAVIAFDADAGRKPEVGKALERLNDTLREAGLDVRELRWEESQGKGLDDYLLKDPGRRNEVREFLRESLASLDRGEVSVVYQLAGNGRSHVPKNGLQVQN